MLTWIVKNGGKEYCQGQSIPVSSLPTPQSWILSSLRIPGIWWIHLYIYTRQSHSKVIVVLCIQSSSNACNCRSLWLLSIIKSTYKSTWSHFSPPLSRIHGLTRMLTGHQYQTSAVQRHTRQNHQQESTKSLSANIELGKKHRSLLCSVPKLLRKNWSASRLTETLPLNCQ